MGVRRGRPREQENQPKPAIPPSRVLQDACEDGVLFHTGVTPPRSRDLRERGFGT